MSIPKKREYHKSMIGSFVCLFLIFLVFDLLCLLFFQSVLNNWKVAETEDTYILSGTLDGKATIWDHHRSNDKLCFKIDGVEYMLAWYGTDDELESFRSMLSRSKEPVTLTVLKDQTFMERVVYKQRHILAISTATQSVDITEPYNNFQAREHKNFQILFAVLFILILAAEVCLVFVLIKEAVRDLKELRKKERVFRQ